MALPSSETDREFNNFADRTKKTTSRYVVDGEKDFNSVEVVRTTISTTAKKIELPDGAEQILIYHKDWSDSLYFGKTDEITSSIDSAPLTYGDVLQVQLKKGNDNNLYGITGSGSITVYAVGVYRE